MPYCPKCGAEVAEDMTFCSKCGAPLKGAKPETRAEWRRERRINEKEEKHEKGEKQEKGEYGFIGPFIGGLILIFIGVASYLESVGYAVWRSAGGLFVIAIGLIIIIVALAMTARKRNPPT